MILFRMVCTSHQHIHQINNLFCGVKFADSFIDILHSSVRKALEKGLDESIKSEAVQRGSGWLHINGMHDV